MLSSGTQILTWEKEHKALLARSPFLSRSACSSFVIFFPSSILRFFFYTSCPFFISHLPLLLMSLHYSSFFFYTFLPFLYSIFFLFCFSCLSFILILSSPDSHALSLSFIFPFLILLPFLHVSFFLSSSSCPSFLFNFFSFFPCPS